MREAADRRAPHRVATYALELGQAFAAFYRDAPVLNAEDPGLRAFRLQLSVVAQRTLAASLGLLGVSAPEHM
jgi:arginyl-tRNA synthetase